MFSIGTSEKTQRESPSLNLPPVAKDCGKNNITSSNQGAVLENPTCQPTCRETKPKQNDMNNPPNTRWRAFANEIVNLRGNWPIIAARRKNCRDQKKLALTYYTFSGKEVQHVGSKQQRSDKVSLDVLGRKPMFK